MVEYHKHTQLLEETEKTLQNLAIEETCGHGLKGRQNEDNRVDIT